jgi:hypothetical protein
MTPRALALAAALLAAPKAPPPPPPPPPPLPWLPVVARVRVEVGIDHLLVVHVVRFARGEWSAGDVDLHVAFGAPGVPRAVDARLAALPESATEPRPGDAMEPVPSEPSARRSGRARAFLGPETMAGVVLHLREPALRRAFSGSGTAALQIRTLLPLPAPVAGAREIVVRLGVPGGTPAALDAIELAVRDARVGSLRAQASLCGPEADPHPLAVHGAGARPDPGAIAPLHAVRRGTDDLCVRLFTSP